MSESVALDERPNDPVVALTRDEIAPRWTMRSVAMATLIAVGIGLAFLLLYRFYMIVFLFFVALSLATALKPIVGWLQKRNIPLLLGILPFYGVLFGLFVGVLWFIGPTLISQLTALANDLPTYYADLRNYLLNSPNDLLEMIGTRLPVELALPASQMPVATVSTGDPIGLIGQALGNVGNAIFMFIAVLLLAYYWLVEGDMLIRRVVLRYRLEQREEIRAMIAEIEGKIGSYFRGQLLLCLIIGVFSLVAFLIIGVPNALTLSLISGLTEAIPVLGPTIGAVPAILMTLSTAPEKSLWVIIALVVIQGLENNFLVPRIMDKSVGVNPFVTILSIAAFGLLFGIVGAILAIPLAAIIQILVTRLLFSKPTVEEISTPANQASQQTRSRLAVLRLAAQELAQDVRKQGRNSGQHQVHDKQIEQAEDMIEMVASNLETYLVQQERGV
jgi:predicted PurR-regulated permease PerM